MATGTVTANPAAWATALANLRTLQTADLLPAGTPGDIFRSAATDLAAAEVAVLDLHAPTLSAVIHKLAMIWEFKLEGDCQEAHHRRLVMSDLCRLSHVDCSVATRPA